MPLFTKALCFLLVPTLLLSILAVPSLRDEAPNGPGGDPWQRFAGDGVAFAVPVGYTAQDPFTTATPYYRKMWFLGWPSKTTRAALLRSDEKVMQVFLHLAPTAELAPFLEQARTYYDGNVLVEEAEPGTWRTRDGVEIAWRRIRYTPGLLGGDDDTYVLGHGTVGDRTFIVNAGGRTADFDFDAVALLVSDLTLGR